MYQLLNQYWSSSSNDWLYGLSHTSSWHCPHAEVQGILFCIQLHLGVLQAVLQLQWIIFKRESWAAIQNGRYWHKRTAFLRTAPIYSAACFGWWKEFVQSFRVHHPSAAVEGQLFYRHHIFLRPWHIQCRHVENVTGNIILHQSPISVCLYESIFFAKHMIVEPQFSPLFNGIRWSIEPPSRM